MVVRAGRGRIGAILGAGLALLLVVGLGEVVSSPPVADWDAQIIERLARNRRPAVAGWMAVVSLTGAWIAIPVARITAGGYAPPTGIALPLCAFYPTDPSIGWCPGALQAALSP